MPGASYPKPSGQKVTRHQPVLGWVSLPAEGRQGAAPALPEWRDWSPGTLAWWADLWSTPQATMWDQSGRSLWVLAVLVNDLIAGTDTAAKLEGAIRQHQDRHGLSPKAMLQLRWVVAEPAQADSQPRTPVPRSRKAPTMRILAGGRP